MSRPSLIKSSVGSGAGPVVSARDDCRRDAGVGVVERCGAEERLRIVAPPAVSVEAAPLLPRRWVGDVSAENLEENDADGDCLYRAKDILSEDVSGKSGNRPEDS